ncbi:replication initiation protein [Photobacterium sp. ZSDE20]|uniref:Replication initiation protein n=1 Tax=Photobacterium pectinilyticum TaxID=2906793 RepID=A0ABT1N352_9GAMM|nr:replication initiation protein [Photobacterium sp. ZSDE20]MCQ1059163.1 replication initiation protein [Photobacterium sp. ZSDE20]MDD1829906.1 replication initiation protein [Photobacterium sp. ZSDE20]
MSSTPKKFVKKPDHYVVPIKILDGRQDLTRHQRGMMALSLLAMQQERNRLYEVDPEGKLATKGMGKKEAAEHYNQYLPSNLSEVNRFHSFDKDTVAEFLNVADSSFLRTVKRACLAIQSKSIMIEGHDGKGSFLSFVPIPHAEYKRGELTLGVWDHAVPHIMNHARGFSQVDLVIWSKLSSQHSLRLLELVSRDKRFVEKKYELSEFRRLFGVDFKVYEDATEAAKAGKALGDYVEVKNFDTGLRDRIPVYPDNKDLKVRVIDPAFSQIIKCSDGVWVPTDSAGKGYELLSGDKPAGRGRPATHIKVCLKFHGAKSKLDVVKKKPSEHTLRRVLEDMIAADPTNADAVIANAILSAMEARTATYDQIRAFYDSLSKLDLKADYDTSVLIDEFNANGGSWVR